jgi:hypothetical protein
LSTLAVDRSSGVAGPSRAISALRYVDLLLLAAALPIFIAADLPIAGYAVVAAVWVAQHGIEYGADRLAARALAEGNRRAAMGWVGATTLARVWLVALAVLLVGLSEREAGLAAAVLAAILFTVHLGGRLLVRLLQPEERG